MQNIIDGENLSGPWVGTGAQKAAWAFAPLVLMTVSPTKRREYWAAQTPEARDDLVRDLISRGYEVNERVDGARPSRPCIDYDGAPNSDETLDQVVEVFRTVAISYGIPPEHATPNVSVSDRPGKLSAHLVADEWTLRDGAQVKAFQVAIKKEMGAAAAAPIDIIANGSSYGLRVVGSPKHGVPDAELVVERGPRTLNYHYLQGEDNMFDVDRSSTDGPVQSTGLRAHVDEFRQAVADRFEYLEEGPESAGCLSWLRTAPAFCTVCRRDHDTDNAFSIVTASGTGMLFCRRANAEGVKTPLFVHEMSTPDPVLAAARAGTVTAPAVLTATAPAPATLTTTETRTEPSADSFDSILAHPDVQVVDKRYCSDAFGEAERITDEYWAAAWGTGKTYAYCRRIRALLERDPDAVIMLISCRKTLSAQICKDTGAISYSEIKGRFDPRANPLTVWQVDSLTRVSPVQLPRLDLLIIDESMMLASHVFGTAHPSSRAISGVATLRMLVKKTRQLLVCDNDLSARQVQVFQAQRPAGTNSRVLRNAYQPWKGNSADLYRSSLSVETRLWETVVEQNRRRLADKAWHGVSAVCHTKKRATALHKRAVAICGEENVRLYTGDTSDEVKAADFSDATTAWTDLQVVIYTSTASVGISCDLPHFADCFAFFNASGNAGVNQSAQMLFRMRHTTQWFIAVEGSRVSAIDAPVTPAAFFKSCAGFASAQDQIPDAFRDDRTEAVGLETTSNPQDLAKFVAGSFSGSMWLGEAMERNRSWVDFVGRLTRSLKQAGIKVSQGPSLATKKEKAETGRKRRAAEDIVGAEQAALGVAAVPAYLTFEDENGRAVESAARAYTSEGAITLRVPANLRLGREVVITARTYGVDPRAVTPSWFRQVAPYAEGYLRLKRYLRKETAPRGLLEDGSERVAGRLIEQALNLAGFQLDKPGEGPKKIDVKNAALINAIRKLNAQAFKLYGDSNGWRRSKYIPSQKTITASINAALGRHFGGELVGCYRSGKNLIGYELTWHWHEDIAPAPNLPWS